MGAWIAQKKGQEEKGWYFFEQDRKLGIRKSKLIGSKKKAEQMLREYKDKHLRRALNLTGDTLTVYF